MIIYNENITNSCGTAGDTASQQVEIQYTYMYKYLLPSSAYGKKPEVSATCSTVGSVILQYMYSI